MKRLICTVGLPRSGKTTWARKQGMPIVNPDSIRLAIHGRAFVSIAEPLVWAIAQVMVRALFLAGHDNVILDATNVTRARRDQWRSKDWETSFRPFYESREVCYSRATESLKVVIDKMFHDFEPFGSDEDYWPETDLAPSQSTK